MIPHLDQQKNWQDAFSDLIDSPEALAQALSLPSDAFADVFAHANSGFALKVPRQFVQKMRRGDIHDPLLRQVLPTFAENVAVSGFVTDPLGENAANPLKGIIHKYASRVLIPVTGACMVHCRYCFRQHFAYNDNLPTGNDWQAIGEYIRAHPAIHEVILSGGDPLSLNERRLNQILDTLEALPQIRTIRLHSRVPVVIPERLDDALLTRLQASRCQIVLVVHANHPNELDDATLHHLARTRMAGVTVLNQSVLLKGINDNADTLAKLSERLWQAQVLPYYLHVLDKVAGAAHFYIPDEQAVEIYWQLLAKCAGYLVPKLVRELPDQPNKTPLDLYRHAPAIVT